MSKDHAQITAQNVDSKSIDERVSRFKNLLAITEESLLEMSIIWTSLKNDGYDLSEFECDLSKWFPLIAKGQLDPKAVISFAGRPSLLREVANGMPLEQQRKLAEGEKISVVVPGTKEIEEMSATEIPAVMHRKVFSSGKILTPNQQKMAMKPTSAKDNDDDAEEERERFYDPIIDREKGTVKVGTMTFKLSVFLAKLSASTGPDRPIHADLPETYIEERVRFHKDEHKQFLKAVRASGLPSWELIRKACRAFGLV